jgi:deoxycytidylate deaminase
MNNFLNKYYDLFFNEASKSDICFQLAAGIIINNNLISKPYCNKYSQNKKLNLMTIHAEVNSIINYHKNNIRYNKKTNTYYLSNNKYKKINIFVIRFHKNGVIANSRPCYNCLKMMKDLNVNKVYYSSGYGNEIICENVKNMVTLKLSFFYKLNDIIELFINNFPNCIKEYNLNCFLKFTDSILYYKISSKNNNKIIIFYNKNYDIIKIINII